MRFTFSPRKSPSSLSGKIIGSIREDSERNLWISYQDANPDRLNLDDFRIRPFIPDYQVSYDYPINSLSELCNLCVSEESWFWGGADEGRLRVWDTKTRALITYRYIPDEMNPLASNHIHCLFVDSSGYLWIGTNAGLDQYDKRTGRFDHFTVQDGLSGNIVRGIREGEPGILFVSTNKGLSRLDIQNRHIVNYTTANGLLSNEFMGGACCKRKSGELVFGSNEGIVSFDPVQLTDGLRKYLSLCESRTSRSETHVRSKVYRWVLLRSIILIPVVSDTGIVWMDMIRIGGRWTPAIVRLYITVYHRETMCFGWKLPAMVPIGALPLPNLSGSFLLGGGRGGLFCWYSWLYAYCCVSPIRAGCAGINFAKPSWSVRYKNVHGC